MRISTKTFEAAAREVVPGLRAMMADLELSGVDATPSARMTAVIDIDGQPARVRVTVELDPEDDED